MTRPLLDEYLVQSAAGDAEAFGALYQATAAQAFGLARRLLYDHTAAEDAVQEAYLTLWRTAANFDPCRGSCRAWVLMVVHRTAVNNIRAAEARSARDARHYRMETALRGGDDDPAPELVHAADEARTVRAALAGLSLHHRQALELAYFGGYTAREVAGALGVPLGTAKTRIRDGRIRLRESLSIQSIRSARSTQYDTKAG